MDLLGGLSMAPSSVPSQTLAPGGATSKAATVDLLGDLFGGSAVPTASNLIQTVPVDKTVSPVKSDPLANLVGDSMKAAAPQISQTSAFTCYNKNGLVITLSPRKESSQKVMIDVKFSTISGQFSNLTFQVAVPRVIKLVLII